MIMTFSQIDLFFPGDVINALGLNTTKKVYFGHVQADEEEKKCSKFDDVDEKINAAKTTSNSSGTFAYNVQLLEPYDKNCNKILMLAGTGRHPCQSLR